MLAVIAKKGERDGKYPDRLGGPIRHCAHKGMYYTCSCMNPLVIDRLGMSKDINAMISLEEALELVTGAVELMPIEQASLLESVGRVAAADLASDIDVAPFAHSAMDGFALRAEQIEGASEDDPVELSVIAEVAAGDVFDGAIGEGECVRIMTGAELPADADAVVKYEIVRVVAGDGLPGSTVAFAAPCKVGSNVRAAGEEAKAGEVVIHKGDIISKAGVGYLASCGVLDVPVYRRPRVALMATGSELVPPTEVPGPGHIRESNSYAMAACAAAAGALPTILPIVPDTFDDLANAVSAAVRDFDFVITTGGAANGDFDFIKKVVDELGELKMTLVNMRPGKAQTFGFVGGTPVFGLPGNPAAAYCGFEMIIRPALRVMQGYTFLAHPKVTARLASDVRRRDPRMTLLRSTMTKAADGTYEVLPATNQSSGLFGVIQRSNCMAILPEGPQSLSAGDMVECVLLDIPEEVEL